jgi:hypothetical protein
MVDTPIRHMVDQLPNTAGATSRSTVGRHITQLTVDLTEACAGCLRGVRLAPQLAPASSPVGVGVRLQVARRDGEVRTEPTRTRLDARRALRSTSERRHMHPEKMSTSAIFLRREHGPSLRAAWENDDHRRSRGWRHSSCHRCSARFRIGKGGGPTKRR